MATLQPITTAAGSQAFSNEAVPHPSQANPAESDLWVFREGQKQIAGRVILRDLRQRVSRSHTAGELTDALIQAGELESALADAAHPGCAAAAQLTDALAWALWTGKLDQPLLQRLATLITAPEQIRTYPPEGFTYYALHPLDFARLTSSVRDEPKACAVIGIRTIGTTLSAVVAAALRAQMHPVSRITVRPTGHPYSRVMDFSREQLQWIREQLCCAAQFLVVDEGPGRSGSTFLAVVEALVRSGVPRELITILGSRQVDSSSLLAEQAGSRWNAFRFLSTAPSVSRRFEGCRYVGGGEWRQWLLTEAQAWRTEEWPESWTQMERLKFLSQDGATLFKFEGMGPLGAAIRQRANVLAEAGFSPPASDIGDGFLAYPVVKGSTLRPRDLSTPLLEQMARYCAFRAAHFAASSDRPDELRHMVQYNVHQELGLDLVLPEGALVAEQAVLVDGRMQPHEWVAGERICKTDSVDHGDDHFFPGPCDIAWDLAGAAVEWQMSEEAAQAFLQFFRRLSQIDVSERLPFYMLAYAIFRLGFCKMAISTGSGDDLHRLRQAYGQYRRLAMQLAESHTQTPRELSAA